MKNKINESKLDKKGCLMVNYKGIIGNWSEIVSMIDKDDVYDDETRAYGIEDNPHCTILYGVDPSVTHQEVIDFVKDNIKEPIKAEIIRIGKFENDEYDVLKFDVSGVDLFDLNKLIADNFPFKNDYPDYKPHITIGYLKKGTADKYVRKIKNIVIKSSKFEYSIGSKNTKLFKI